MRWSAVAARSHAQRLEAAGWLARYPMTRGAGSLFVATRSGVAVAGLSLRSAGPPAPTSWAHHCGCAWVAASLTARDHAFLGPPELLDDRAWSGEITWRDRRGSNSSTHRPDLIGAPDVNPTAIEVELTKKSSERLRAIIGLHAQWHAAGWTGGVVYICGDEDVRARIESAAEYYGISDSNPWFTTKPLDRIRTHTLQTYERHRAELAPPVDVRCLPVMAREKGKRPRRDRPAREPESEKDPGPPYVVLWHPDADAERDASWPAAEKVAMLHAAQKLEAAGPRLGHPHSSAVQGEPGQGLRELRPRAGRSRWRPIYRRVTPTTFVILAVGPEAQIDARGFARAVARAVDRFGQLELD
jgi:hypothetical protein